MCPADEQELRTVEKLIHPLEVRPNLGWQGEPLLIKQFSRSAAGHRASRPSDLRPAQVCRATTNHLVSQILLPRLAAAKSFDLRAYDFVFDRLRAIRQDLTVQQVRDHVHLHVLEVCVKFHLTSSYMFLTDESTAKSFDAHINFKHLLECLKMTLVLQQELEMVDGIGEMAAIYLLLNLGEDTAVSWALNQMAPGQLKAAPVASALKISRLYTERNFVGMFKIVEERLALMPLLAIHWKLPQIFDEVLAVMSVAYSSKVLRYPLQAFSSNYLLDQQTAEQTCQDHCVCVEQGLKISFSKASFKSAEKTKWRNLNIMKEAFVNCNWESILLFRDHQLLNN